MTEEEKSKGMERILEEGTLFPNAPEFYRLPTDQIASREWNKDSFKSFYEETQFAQSSSPKDLYTKLFGSTEEASQKAEFLYNNASSQQNDSAKSAIVSDLQKKLITYVDRNKRELLDTVEQAQDTLGKRGEQRIPLSYALTIIPNVDTETEDENYNTAKSEIDNMKQEIEQMQQNPQDYVLNKLEGTSDGIKGFALSFLPQIIQDYVVLRVNQGIDTISEQVGGLKPFLEKTIDYAKEETEEGISKAQLIYKLAHDSYEEIIQAEQAAASDTSESPDSSSE